MNKQFLNKLTNYEDEAVELSHSNYLMNTDIDCFHLNTDKDPMDILTNFLHRYSPVVNSVKFYNYIINMIKGDYLNLPLFYGIYESKNGLIIGYNTDKLIYQLDEYDEYYHLSMLNGLVNCDFILSDFNTTCTDIIETLDPDIEIILLHDYFAIAKAIKIKVNKNRSLAEIEKGIDDSISLIIKKLMKSKHLNPYL